ncbi:MAG: histone deacetylase [Deltaproteobacteria bacterium]|nr:histone deacetylase [Deltaproteobacteria bacterium]
MQWFYDPGYDYGGGLPGSPREVHGFLLHKPSEIRAQLLRECVVSASAFHSATPVFEQELHYVHEAEMIAELSDVQAIARAIELPEAALLPLPLVRRAVVLPQLCAAGGTCEALRVAAHGEWAINLSGGFHHARRDLSYGFCLVNDVALGIARLRRAGVHRRVLIFDLDLHQGDGNATIFTNDPEVYTVSIHEEAIFPLPKVQSNLDIGLPSYTGDEVYLTRVQDAFTHIGQHFQPELIIYIAGSDPYKDDPLGSLQLTESGLLARDQLIGQFARELGCPLVALPAGGYSDKSPAITAAGFRALAAMERAE